MRWLLALALLASACQPVDPIAPDQPPIAQPRLGPVQMAPHAPWRDWPLPGGPLLPDP